MLSNGIRTKTTNKPKAARKFFKKLHKQMVKYDYDSEGLESEVIITVKAVELLHMGVQMMNILNGNALLNELLIGEAVGDYNWQIESCAKKRGWTTQVSVAVDRVRWERWMEEVVPLFLLLSKKQRMSDEDYMKCARSVMGVVRVKLEELM